MSCYGKRFGALLALIGAIALVAVGCGGDDGDGVTVEEASDEAETVAETSGATVGEVVAAVSFINDLGFHDMSEALAEGELEPHDVSTVRKAQGVVGSIEWPESIGETVESFEGDLDALESALVDEDKKAAADAGHAVHESQHAFSTEAIGALGELESETTVAGVLGAVNYANGAGFHDMSEELGAGELEPYYLDKVGGVIGVIGATSWPESLGDEVEAFSSDLEALEAALAEENVKAAAKAGEAVHGSQHDFSGTAVEALGSVDGGSETGQAVAGITYLDGVGFHDMSEELAKGELEPHYLDQVASAATVVGAIDWAGELASPMQQFSSELGQLEAALADEDVKAAAEAAEGVHASQHGVSDGLLAALGAESEDEHTASTGGGGQEVTIEVTDWAFERPEIEVSEGDVTLTVTNRGEMPHGIYLSEFKINEKVPAGETKEITFHADEAGRFQFICNEPMCGTAAQHAGMVGQLVVNKG